MAAASMVGILTSVVFTFGRNGQYILKFKPKLFQLQIIPHLFYLRCQRLHGLIILSNYLMQQCPEL